MEKTSSKRPLWWYAMQAALGFFACFLFAVVTCSVVGAYYPQTLVVLHLDWFYLPLRGLYTDCSEPENRNAVYCRPKGAAYDMRKAGVREKRKPPAFSLYKSPG